MNPPGRTGTSALRALVFVTIVMVAFAAFFVTFLIVPLALLIASYFTLKALERAHRRSAPVAVHAGDAASAEPSEPAAGALSARPGTGPGGAAPATLEKASV